MWEAYSELITKFRQGEPLGPVPAELESLARALGELNQRRFASFTAGVESLLRSETLLPIRGDLLYLQAHAAFMRADYPAAADLYGRALGAHRAECRLFTPGLIRYNLFVVRSFAPEFEFRREFRALSRIRREATRAGDAPLAGLCLNSFGNHYYQRGSFTRAYRLYREAVSRQESGGKLSSYLDATANAVRAALQIGEWSSAEGLIQGMNARILRAEGAFGRERFDRVYAEYLFTLERYDESLTHLDFSFNPEAAFESARMLCLKAQARLELGQDGARALLVDVRTYIEKHRVSESGLIDLHTSLARAFLDPSQGAPKLEEAYREVLKAETLAQAHHNPSLRAQVMLQKARLNHARGRIESAARIAIECLRLADGQRFFPLFCQGLRFLAVDPALFRALDDTDRGFIAARLANPSLERLSRTRRAAELLRGLSGAPSHPSPAAVRTDDPASGIFVDEASGLIRYQSAGRGEEIARTHRMTGKLLCELLRAPNRDLTLDHLHVKLWGGPIRNESHVQKLKTLVSRLRTDLRAKGVPATIESREYSSYRLVCSASVKSGPVM